MSRPTLPNSLVYALILVTGLISCEGVGNARHLASVQQKKSAKSRRPTPAAIWKRIKAAAQDELRSNSPLIIAPKFTVKQIGSTRQLTIVKGDVSGLGFREDDPYELPLKKQILIEALRRSLTETDLTGLKTPAAKSSSRRVVGNSEAESAVQPYLVSAENLVKKTVVDIESEPDKNRLDEKLRDNEKQIDDILYDKIYQAVEQVARRKGYNIIYGRGGGEPKKFSVNITTVPDGARVFIMRDREYQMQLFMKTNPSQWPWLEIVQNPYQLLGKYRYRTVWRDGKHAEGDINVLNDSPLRFQPN
jgi:hypothetical protein